MARTINRGKVEQEQKAKVAVKEPKNPVEPKESQNAVGSPTTDLKDKEGISPSLGADRPFKGHLNAKFEPLKLEVIAKPYSAVGIRVLSDGFIFAQGLKTTSHRLPKNMEIVVQVTAREKAMLKPVADKMMKQAPETK